MLTIMPPMFIKPNQLNTKQETKTVNIISILPAKVAVDNSQINGTHKPSARLLAQSLAVLSATTSVLAAIPERRQGQLAAEL